MLEIKYLFMKCIYHSTETVLCFRESRFVFPCVVKCCFLSSDREEREPAYCVEQAPCAFHNHYLFIF